MVEGGAMIERIDIVPAPMDCYHVIVNDDPEHDSSKACTSYAEALLATVCIISDEWWESSV